MAVYMQYADVKGSVTAAGHEKWIECHSFQWGCGRGVSTPTGAAKNRESGLLSCSDVTITKTQDAATQALFRESLDGTEGDPVTFHVVTTSAEGTNTILEIKLAGALISGYSASSGGDRPSESISISANDVEFTFHSRSFEGTTSTEPYTVGYNIAEAKPR